MGVVKVGVVAHSPSGQISKLANYVRWTVITPPPHIPFVYHYLKHMHTHMRMQTDGELKEIVCKGHTLLFKDCDVRL